MSTKTPQEEQQIGEIVVDFGDLCRTARNNGTDPYRVIISKKNLESKDFDFAKYIQGNDSEEFDSTPTSKFIEDGSEVTIGDYRFFKYKTTKETRGDIHETLEKLKKTNQWFMILPCETWKQTHLRFRHDFKDFKKFVTPTKKIRNYNINLKEKIDCKKIKAPQSIMQQCLISKNIDLTQNALDLYQEASIENINQNNNKDNLKVASFNMNNFRGLTIDEEPKLKTNITLGEKVYNPFGKKIEEDSILKQLNNIIITNPDIICLQQANESVEYRSLINDYFAEGASARLGINFRNAYSDTIKNNNRLNKKQIEELCLYHQSIVIFQYLWRLRESRNLLKKISFLFLLRWLFTAGGFIPNDFKKRLPPNQRFSNPHARFVEYDCGFKELIKFYNNKVDTEWKNELKLHDFETRQLYVYRNIILANSENIIKQRPEIVHTVANDEAFKNNLDKSLNLLNILKETEYYKTRFEPTPADYSLADNAPVPFDRVYTKIVEKSLNRFYIGYKPLKGKYDKFLDPKDVRKQFGKWQEQKDKYIKKVNEKKNKDAKTSTTLISFTVKNMLQELDKIIEEDDNPEFKQHLDKLETVEEDDNHPITELKATISGMIPIDTRTLTKSNSLEKYNDQKMKLKPRYYVKYILPNFNDKPLEDNKIEEFNPTKWIQEECYRILNIHDGVAPEHNHTPRKGDYNAKYQYNQIKWSYQQIRSSLLELFDKKKAEKTKSIKNNDDIRDINSILNPRVYYKVGGEGTNHLTDLQSDKVKVNKTYHSKDPISNNADIFEEFIEIWRNLLNAFDDESFMREGEVGDMGNFPIFVPNTSSTGLDAGDPLNDYFNIDSVLSAGQPLNEEQKYQLGNSISTIFRIIFQKIKDPTYNNDLYNEHNLTPWDENEKILGVFGENDTYKPFGKSGSPKKIESGKTHDNMEQYPTDINKTNIGEIDNKALKNWVVDDLWEYFISRYGNFGDDILTKLLGKDVDLGKKNWLGKSKKTHLDTLDNIKKQGGYKEKLRFFIESVPAEEKEFREYSARIFDILLGQVFVKKDKTTQAKFGNDNRLQETFIHKKMYEDSFNNIVDESAFYRYKLKQRMDDKEDYINDYIISQRSWLNFYLKGHGFIEHSSTSTGLAIYYKPKLRNDRIKIIAPKGEKKVELKIKTNYLNEDVLVGYKSQLKIGGKDVNSTVKLNLINIDMQYCQSSDLPALYNEILKLNIHNTEPTLLVGTFPIDPTNISNPGEFNSLTNHMYDAFNTQSSLNAFLVEDVFDSLCSNNCRGDPSILSKISYPQISDYLVTKDTPVSNCQFLCNPSTAFKTAFLTNTPNSKITVEGTHMIYTNINRHVGRITEFSLDETVDSTITHGGSKKTKKVRKHKGIIQIGGNAGRLRKGYKYTGIRLKSGLAQIIRVNTNKN